MQAAAIAGKTTVVSRPSGIPGRCLVDDGVEFACTAHDVCPTSARIAGPAQVHIGQVVTCYLDNIGMIRGRVASRAHSGFILQFDLSEVRRGRIAARLEWYASRAAEGAEQRAAPRIVPVHRDVEVRLGEDMVVPGRIIDLSSSGAAIAVDRRFRPFVGALVRVGKRYATVVRLLEEGIAVQFKLPFVAETFNQHVVL